MKKIILSIACFAIIVSMKAQKLESYTQESWINQEWQLTFRNLYNYDALGIQNQTDYDLYNFSSSAWEESSRDTMYFDANGRIDSIISSLYNSTSMQWNESRIGTYEYSPEGNILSYLTENIVDEMQVPSYVTSYMYDPNGFQIQSIYSNWDAQTGSWQGSFKTETTPNAEGKVDSLHSYMYSEDIQDWVGYQKIKFNYSSTGKISERFIQGFVYGNWINISQTFYEYDASDNLVLERMESWNSQSGTWVFNSRIEYTNTSFGKVEQMLSRYYDSNDSTWKNSQRGNYVYSTPNAIDKRNDFSVHAFPNPATSNIQFNTNVNYTAQVFDINGRVVLMDQIDSVNKSLNIEILPSGVYLVKLMGENEVHQTKFVKVN